MHNSWHQNSSRRRPSEATDTSLVAEAPGIIPTGSMLGAGRLLWFGVHVELFHFSVEVRAVESQPFRGERHVAARLANLLLNVLALKRLGRVRQRKIAILPRGGWVGRRRDETQVVAVDLIAACKIRQTLDEIPKFPHVTRPAMNSQSLLRGSSQSRSLPTCSRGEVSEKELGQKHDIIATFAEWR